MLVGAGLKNIFTIDIHAAQTEGFFDSGFHNLSGKALILQSLKKRFAGSDVLVAFPDEGEAKRNEDDGLTDKLRVVFGPRVAFAQFSKTRGAEANSIARSELLTKVDPTGRSAVIFDDLLDTGGTALKSAEELKRKGVREVVLAMTHMVASQNAIERAKAARVEVHGEQVPTVDAIYTTDSLPISAPRGGFVHVTSLAPLYAEVIRRVCTGDRHASLRGLGEVFSGLNGRGSLGTIH
jgi:ribose-phosphate pyrophosphokinase